MNEKYVTSLELSKQLKEAGVPQESEWYWCWYGGDELIPKLYSKGNLDLTAFRDIASAFHVGELGDLLPTRSNITIAIQKGSKEYHVNYWWGIPNPLREGKVTDFWSTHNKILVEAMGEMLLYLKEHGLI